MSFRIRYSFLFGVGIFLIVIGIFLGPANLTIHQILDGLLFTGDGLGNTIVWSLRIPRIIVSLLAGGCLGLAGVLIQFSTRSSLGDANLFGVGGGGAIFVALVYAGVLSFDQHGIFLGSVSCSVLVALLLAKFMTVTDITPIKFAIIGIAVGSLTITVGTSVISHAHVFPAQVIGLVSGSFTSSSWSVVYYLLPTLIFCVLGALILSAKFYPLMLGDTLSNSLGVDPTRTKFATMLLVGILAGASVYAAGLIGFVGLTSPHIARKLFGNTPSHMILGSILIGGLITIFADQIARLLVAPIELPVSMATTVIGAPVMIYLALKIK